MGVSLAMKIRFLTIVLGSFCVAAPAMAEPFKIATDFDGDSISDITYTTTTTDSLSWKSVPSKDGGTALNEIFGKLTDTPILAHWLDSDQPTICTIKKPTRKGALSWELQKSGGELDSRSFGKTGDLVLGGGDFNGNGIDDAAVVRLSGKKLIWNFSLDLFSSSSSTVRRKFGVAGDRAFYASPTGLSDWIGVFGKSGKKKTRLMLLNLDTKETMSTRKLPRRLTRLPRPRPVPVKQDDGTDLLAFVESIDTGSGKTRISVFSLDGELINEKSFSGTGEVTIGEYLSDEAGEEIAFHSATKIRMYNPVTLGAAEAAVVSGIPLDEITSTQVAPAPTPTPTATPTPTETPDPNE